MLFDRRSVFVSVLIIELFEFLYNMLGFKMGFTI